MSLEVIYPSPEADAGAVAAAELRAAVAAHKISNPGSGQSGDIYELIYFLEGGGTVRVEGQQGVVAVAAGDSVMAAAGRISVTCNEAAQAADPGAGPPGNAGAAAPRDAATRGVGATTRTAPSDGWLLEGGGPGTGLAFLRLLIPYDFMRAADDAASVAASRDAAAAVTQHWHRGDSEPVPRDYLRHLLAATERQARELDSSAAAAFAAETSAVAPPPAATPSGQERGAGQAREGQEAGDGAAQSDAGASDTWSNLSSLSVQVACLRLGSALLLLMEQAVSAVFWSGARSRAWLSATPFVKRSLSEAPSFRMPNQENLLALMFDPTSHADAPPFTFGIEIFPPMHRTPPHVHASAHELFFIISGEGEAFCDGTRFAVGPGDTLVFPPGCEHGIDNATGRRMYCLELMLPNEMFAELVRAGTPVDGLDGSDMCVLASIGCR